jgi:F-type H+-transporting ATPase subunit alpha
VVTLWALQKDYYAKIDTAKVQKSAESLREFFATRKDALLTKIRETAKLTDEIEAELKTSCDEWASTQA